MSTQRLLFITGVSSGFGRALAQHALRAGHGVVGTVRTREAQEAFEQLQPGKSFGRLLDVTDVDAIPAHIAAVEAAVGPIDVVVNNAGYGHEGVMEESPLDELRRQFDVNVFGAVAAMKAVLPFMRQRRRGHIINITSMGGFITMPGISCYCGSKFALEGICEALGQEVKALGIAVTAVTPGSFRADWAGRSMVRSPRRITTASQPARASAGRPTVDQPRTSEEGRSVRPFACLANRSSTSPCTGASSGHGQPPKPVRR